MLARGAIKGFKNHEGWRGRGKGVGGGKCSFWRILSAVFVVSRAAPLADTKVTVSPPLPARVGRLPLHLPPPPADGSDPGGLDLD